MVVAAQQDSITLLRRISKGERDAFTRFYDSHASLVYTFAMRILRHQADAEELVQDIFVQVWQKASTYAPERGAPEAWLITMTRSRALDRLRSQRRREQRVTLVDEPQLLEEKAGEAPKVADLGDQEAAQDALSSLPQEQQSALRLAYFEGLSQSEIAGRLALPLGTVKTRIRDALLYLRARQKGQGEGVKQL